METIESCRYDTSGHARRKLEPRDLICRTLAPESHWEVDRIVRGDQLTRQWRIVSLLSGRAGRSLDQLKAELGVTKRTIQRDIAVLEAAGFPVMSEVARWNCLLATARHYEGNGRAFLYAGRTHGALFQPRSPASAPRKPDAGCTGRVLCRKLARDCRHRDMICSGD